MQQDGEKIIEIDMSGVVVLNKYVDNIVSGLWWKTNFASLSGFVLHGFFDAISQFLLGFRYHQDHSQRCYLQQKERLNFPSTSVMQIF